MMISLNKIAHSTAFCSGRYRRTAPLAAKQHSERFSFRLHVPYAQKGMVIKMKKQIAMITVLMALLLTAWTASAENLNIGVLCYHSITDNPLKYSQYCISAEEFEDDIRYFSENGYTFLKPCEMWNADPDAKNIVITSDDGYDDFYECAFPILKKYNAKAAVYVIGTKIDKHGYLKSEQIKEMDASGLVEIGNHTTIMHKRSNRTLRNYFDDETMLNEYVEDIKDCSARIYGILGHGTESFSYPYGLYTDRLERTIRTNLGYTTTFTTNYGLVRTQEDILSPMKRIYRVHGDKPQDMADKINSLK